MKWHHDHMMKSISIILLFICMQSQAQQVFGFKQIPPEFNNPKEPYLVKNMPEIKSQDSIGICYSFSASTILEHSLCKEYKVDCKSPEAIEKYRPSTLALCKYATDAKAIDASNANSYPKKIDDLNSFGADILKNVLSIGKVSKESCAPFDKFVAKEKNPKAQASIEEAIWRHFRLSFEQMAKQFKGCEECALKDIAAQKQAEDMIQKFSLKTTNQEVLKAFASASYEEFLYRVLVPEACTTKPSNRITVLSQTRNLRKWPDSSTPVADYNKAIEQIKENLKNDRPIMVDRFCTLQAVTKDCKSYSPNGSEPGSHSFVISGYRSMCNAAGDKCYDSVKVHNSWGQSWQDQNNDGWVDARTLIDRTQYQFGSLAWFE